MASNNITDSPFKCGVQDTKNALSGVSFFHNYRREKRAPTPAPSELTQMPAYYKKYVTWSTLYVELAIVFDNSMYIKYNRDIELLHDRAKRLVALVNSLYQPLNIKIALVAVEVWSDRDRVTVSHSGDATLDQFHKYRKYYMRNELRNDNAQLITNIAFEAGVVGKAIKGSICSTEMSDGVVNDHSSRDMAVAATMAHELGHNFGMEHDTETCECPTDRCIMAASSGSREPLYWSSCSLEYLSWSLSHGGDFCLKDYPKKLFNTEHVCGNGFTESGEDCDCGFPNVCTNPCCDANTCKFKENASCATGECCDLATCQMKPSATSCRSIQDECDLPEYCDGKSEHCPQDTYKHDGLSCKNDQAYCYGGKCGVRAEQCQLIWGISGSNAQNACYDLNTRGDPNGNCALIRYNDTYIPCAKKDIECGLLHCTHKNEKTVFGDKPVIRFTNSILRVGQDVTVCQGVMIDLGSDGSEDPGYVPNGSKCGQSTYYKSTIDNNDDNEKMCVKQKCITVKSVKDANYCPNNCYNHGVCNNLGHCHCDYGLGGVDCGVPGHGGSIDSGPVPPELSFNVTAFVLILLFVVLPIIAIALLVFRNRRKLAHKFPFLKFLDTLIPKKPIIPDLSNKRPPRPQLPTTIAKPPISVTTGNNNCPTKPNTYFPIMPPNVLNSNGGQSTISASSINGINPPLLLSPPTPVHNSAISNNVSPTVVPNRPKRPDSETLEKLYAEAPELAAKAQNTWAHKTISVPHKSLLEEVLAVVDNNNQNQKACRNQLTTNQNEENDDKIVPHRRAPAPPSNFKDNKASQPNKKNVVADAKKLFEKPLTATTISHPVNPIIGGEPANKAPSLTVVSTIASAHQNPSSSLNRGLGSQRRKSTDVSSPTASQPLKLPVVGFTLPKKPTNGGRVQRSVSSVSSNQNGATARPSNAPPPPPPPLSKKPVHLLTKGGGVKNSTTAKADSSLTTMVGPDNYYDVIPSPGDPLSQKQGVANSQNQEDEDFYADIDEYRRDGDVIVDVNPATTNQNQLPQQCYYDVATPTAADDDDVIVKRNDSSTKKAATSVGRLAATFEKKLNI